MKKVMFLLALVVMLLSMSACDLLGLGDGDNSDDNTVPITPENLFFVTESDRSSLNSSSTPMVDMEFTSPDDFGATSFTLQYSDNGGTTWANLQYYGDDLVATGSQDNFSLNIGGSYRLRLLITGGTYDGQTSNEMDVTLSSIATYFSSWSLDESVYNTGTMPPNAGYGLAASFGVKEVGTNNSVDVSGGVLTYQWYRINPADFEDIELIAGATALTYTTTDDDIGHKLLIRATGDGVNAGGYIQVLSMNIVK